VIEYLGRADTQVKIRGYRIELGEVEAAVREVTGATAVTATTRETADGPRLIAYLTADPGGDLPVGRWHDQLRERLPQYMVPDGYVPLTQLPTNAHGKIDVAALQTRDPGEILVATRPYTAPRTELERDLAGIWADVLHLPRVGVDDDFFALGGHSLVAMRVAARITERLDKAMPLSMIFECPTVATLAKGLGELSDARSDFLGTEIRPVRRERVTHLGEAGR
jgi:acyl carrier protein